MQTHRVAVAHCFVFLSNQKKPIRTRFLVCGFLSKKKNSVNAQVAAWAQKEKETLCADNRK